MIFNENLINNISTIYKVFYYWNNDDDTIKIFIFRYTNEDEYAEQFAEYIVHELVGNTGFIRNIYCNKLGKAIIDTKANNTKKTNKFMNYDI